MYINLLLLLQKDNSSLGLALHFVKMTIPGPSLIENECRKKTAPLASCRYQTWSLILIIPRAFHLGASEGRGLIMG